MLSQAANKEDEVCSSPSSTTLSLPSSTTLSLPSSYSSKVSDKVILNTQKYVTMALPESKSENVFPNNLVFSCDVQCIHSIQYKVHHADYKQFELDKLDIILSPSSTLAIQCILLLNGVENVLESPTWIHKPLNKVMEKCGFHSTQEGLFHVNKAFVTSPLSYLFDKQAPFGILEKLEIIFDWSTTKSKEFQTSWKRQSNPEAFQEYLEHVFTSILVRKSFYKYPLIFSSHYTKKITQTMAYLPYISQSLQKIYTTSKATMSVSNHEFSESMMKSMKTIHQNTRVMNPQVSEEQQHDLSIQAMTAALTLGMYHSVKNANKPKIGLKDSSSPPNALYTVAQLWSITCSTE